MEFQLYQAIDILKRTPATLNALLRGAPAGKQALFVVNLEPRKMMGEVSEGMLFDIGHSDGLTPVLAVPEKEVPNGTRAR